MLGLKARQDSNNFWDLFKAAGEDILAFLKRKKKLKAAFTLIEKQLLAAP
jgi:hypothetical protein